MIVIMFASISDIFIGYFSSPAISHDLMGREAFQQQKIRARN